MYIFGKLDGGSNFFLNMRKKNMPCIESEKERDRATKT